MSARRSQMARMKVVETVPAIGDMEIGDFLYDSTNDKIVLRLITGLVYFSKD